MHESTSNRLILLIHVIYHETVMSKLISGIVPKMALIIPTPFRYLLRYIGMPLI